MQLGLPTSLDFSDEKLPGPGSEPDTLSTRSSSGIDALPTRRSSGWPRSVTLLLGRRSWTAA